MYITTRSIFFHIILCWIIPTIFGRIMNIHWRNLLIPKYICKNLPRDLLSRTVGRRSTFFPTNNCLFLPRASRSISFKAVVLILVVVLVLVLVATYYRPLDSTFSVFYVQISFSWRIFIKRNLSERFRMLSILLVLVETTSSNVQNDVNKMQSVTPF